MPSDWRRKLAWPILSLTSVTYPGPPSPAGWRGPASNSRLVTVLLPASREQGSNHGPRAVTITPSAIRSQQRTQVTPRGGAARAEIPTRLDWTDLFVPAENKMPERNLQQLHFPQQQYQRSEAKKTLTECPLPKIQTAYSTPDHTILTASDAWTLKPNVPLVQR